MFDKWDGLLHTWIMAWDSHKLLTGIGGLFDANIFYPIKDSLAYSDHLFASALIFFPVYVITDNPVLAHNFVMLLSFVLCGVAMMWLAMRLGLGPLLAFLAGFIYAFSPWRFGQMGHAAQLLPHFYTPLAIGALLLLIETKKTRWAVLLAVASTLQMLSSFYLGYMMLTGLGIVAACKLKAIFKNPKEILVKLTAASLISGALIYPFSVPYMKVQRDMGLVRTIDECRELSADALDYFSPPRWNRLWGKNLSDLMKNRFSISPNEQRLFLGVTVLVLGILGLFYAPHRKLFGILLIGSFILSLGPYLHVLWRSTEIPMPYQVLYYTVPGFKALRVPSRFASLLMLPLSFLAAGGLQGIFNKMRNQKRVAGIVSMIVLALVGAEYLHAPLPYNSVKVKDEIPQVYRWLAEYPHKTAIVELPQPSDFVTEPMGFDYMHYSTYHWHKIFNGRSGFLPPTTYFILRKLDHFPERETLTILRDIGIELIIVHLDEYTAQRRAVVEKLLGEAGHIVEKVTSFGSDSVYRIKGRTFQGKKPGQVEFLSLKYPSKVPLSSDHPVELNLRNTYNSWYISLTREEFDVSYSDDASGKEKHFQVGEFLYVPPGDVSRITLYMPPPPEDKPIIERNIRIKSSSLGISWEGKFKLEASALTDTTNHESLSSTFLEIEAPSEVKVGMSFEIKAKVLNDGNALWNPRPIDGVWKGVVRLGIRDWSNLDGTLLLPEIDPGGARGDADKFTEPGEVCIISLSAMPPQRPGTYSFALDMVSEYVAWFSDASGKPKRWITVEVVP